MPRELEQKTSQAISQWSKCLAELRSAEDKVEQLRVELQKLRSEYHNLSYKERQPYDEEQRVAKAKAVREQLERKEGEIGKARVVLRKAGYRLADAKSELNKCQREIGQAIGQARSGQGALSGRVHVEGHQRAREGARKTLENAVVRLRALEDRIKKALAEENRKRQSRVEGYESNELLFVNGGISVGQGGGKSRKESKEQTWDVSEGYAGATVIKDDTIAMMICSNCHEVLGGETSVYECPHCGRQICLKCKCRSCAKERPIISNAYGFEQVFIDGEEVHDPRRKAALKRKAEYQAIVDKKKKSS